LPGCTHTSIVRDGNEQATIHAEQNAIADCAKRGVSCAGCIAYITHYPCVICCRMLLASGICHIKYIHDYNNDELVGHFTREMAVIVENI
jgi:dCMP deaminase